MNVLRSLKLVLFPCPKIFCGRYKKHDPDIGIYMDINLSYRKNYSNEIIDISYQMRSVKNEEIIEKRDATFYIGDQSDQGVVVRWWDRSLINEWYTQPFNEFDIEPSQARLFKHAQIFKRTLNGDIIRKVYINYTFKGPLGGYWFAQKKEVDHWKHIE